MTYVRDSERKQSQPARDISDVCGVCVAVDPPEVALFGVDEADGGILLISVRGTELCTLTGEVFELDADCH